MSLIRRRTLEIKEAQRKKQQLLRDMGCVAAALLLIAVMGRGLSGAELLPATGAAGQIKAYGTASLLASHAALGYILMGILSFLLGVCVTILLYRLKGLERRKEAEGEPQEGSHEF